MRFPSNFPLVSYRAGVWRGPAERPLAWREPLRHSTAAKVSGHPQALDRDDVPREVPHVGLERQLSLQVTERIVVLTTPSLWDVSALQCSKSWICLAEFWTIRALPPSPFTAERHKQNLPVLFRFQNWKEGQHYDGTDEQCGVVYQQYDWGRWDDDNCYKRQGFVCKRRKYGWRRHFVTWQWRHEILYRMCPISEFVCVRSG